MDNVKVSIIIPVYNVERYLEECLKSAVNQTLDNIEIICINDGSTDKSLNILEKYSKKYKSIKIINQDNGGLSAARNSGIKVAKGKYLYFLDSDDYIQLDAMEKCYVACEKDDLDIVIFDAECFYDKKYSGPEIFEVYDRKNILSENVTTGREFYITCNDKGCYKSPVWLNFYKSSFINENKLYFVEKLLHEDEIHTFECLLKAKRVKYIPFKFFKRRFRTNSIMTGGIKYKNIEGYFYIAKHFYKYYLDEIHRDYELSNIVKNNIINLLKYSLLFCDKLSEVEIRKEIEEFISSLEYIDDIDLEIHSQCENLQYSKIECRFDRTQELYSYKNEKKIFYMLVPAHGNLGDQAIAYASSKFFREKYSEHKIIEINYEDTYLYEDIIKKIINQDDFIALHGGGNMGNHYIWEEQARRYIINNFPDATIISMPQTIYFSNDEEGQDQLKITRDMYNEHCNLTLTAREDTSFKIMKENFKNCNVLKCPDIVFYLKDRIKIDNKNIKRRYVTTFFRKDKETYFNLKDKEELINNLRKKYDIIETDTVINKRVDLLNREEELFKIWTKFYKSKVIITDRLHGMIFAAITNTPCIVLRSLDYKVIESYKWIQNLNYIKFVDDIGITNIEKNIDSLIELNELDTYNFDSEYERCI